MTGEADGPRDIVLVTVDSLRADHCGFMGCDRDLTPTLDRVAEDGVAYENAIAPGPRTPSSMPPSFTGTFGPPTSAERTDWQQRRADIDRHMRRYRTTAERLKRRGYTTIGMTLNPWTQGTGFDQGFDRFVHLDDDDSVQEQFLDSGLMRSLDDLLQKPPIRKYTQSLKWWHTRKWFMVWPHYYRRVLEEFEAADGPRFLWVFLLDVHQPYITPRSYRTESSSIGMYYANFRAARADAEDPLPPHAQRRLERAYRDTIRLTDGFIETLVSSTDGEEPILVLHSDHGEAFGEHGTYGHEPYLYEENLHVPLVLANVGTSERVSDPVSLRKMPAMISSLADPGTRFDPAAYTSEYVVSTTQDGKRSAVRGTRWKYIESETGQGLYDLAADPDERESLHGELPEVRRTLRSVLANQRRDVTERAGITTAVEGLDSSL